MSLIEPRQPPRPGGGNSAIQPLMDPAAMVPPLGAALLDARRDSSRAAAAHKSGAVELATPEMIVADLPKRIGLVAAQTGTFARLDLERLLGTNDLVGLEFLSRGLLAARPVARIHLPDRGSFATGFMVSPRLLLTNRHVLESAAIARASQVEFGYELDTDRQPRRTQTFDLDPDAAFVIGDPKQDLLDFALCAVAEGAIDGVGRLAEWGWLRLDGRPGKIWVGEYITMIQHPGGSYKQVGLRENRLVRKDEDQPVLLYVTDTAPGSSGAPCFNDQWQVVALHSRGVPQLNAAGRVEVRGFPDGVPPEELPNLPGLRDTDVTWVANLGIRVSRIVGAVRDDAAAATNPLLRAWLDDVATNGPAFGMTAVATPTPAVAPEPGLGAQLATLIDRLDDALLPVEERRRRRRPAATAAPAREELGYAANFLGTPIPLPLPTAATRQLFGAMALNRDTGQPELPYTHFSIVMCADRRLAYVTAVNIDGRASVPLSRGRDRWRLDPRIPAEAQTDEALYRDEPVRGGNFFDRGHIVRRLDPCWGSPATVQAANDDTFHFTNCAPQHWSFNQGQLLWNGLENYILGNTDAEDVLATVFTGPVFRRDDVVHRGVALPRDFWKIVAVRTASPANGAPTLLASGYTISQAALLRRLDFEELPVGQFETFQRPLTEIVTLTGLDLAPALLRADVLAGAGENDPRERMSVPAGGHRLLRYADIRL